MSKISIKGLAFGCLVASMSSAFVSAEEAGAAAEAAAPAVLADNPLISVSAKIESRYSLIDSSKKETPYFFQEVARFGGNINLGRVNGRVSLGYSGNSTNSSSQNAAPESTGSVGVREAWISYSLLKKVNNYELTAQIGRFMPNGASIYGADANTTYWAGAGNFISADGLALNYTATYGSTNVTAQAALTSAMPVYVFTGTDTMNTGTNTIGSGDSSFGGAPNNNSVATIASLSASHKFSEELSAELAGAYGHRKKSRIGYSDATGTSLLRADLTYMEASAGVRFQSLAFGAWYSKASLGKPVTWNATSTAEPTTASAGYNAAPIVTTSYSVFGLGFQGDSSFFNVQSMLAKDDVLTYGIGWQSMAKTGAATDSSDNNSSLMTAGFGYLNGIFGISANWISFTSKNSVFLKNNDSTAKTAQRFYIMTSLSI